jgi:hypothetical protein
MDVDLLPTKAGSDFCRSIAHFELDLDAIRGVEPGFERGDGVGRVLRERRDRQRREQA